LASNPACGNLLVAVGSRAVYSDGMFGFLDINKPAGPTSHDIVAAVRRHLGRKVKVGHAGTLDPFADGVLVVCVGQATRLADYVQAQAKRYRAEITLGATSSTDDPEGEILLWPDVTPPAADATASVIKNFVGEIEQVPPAHSAVHVNGERAYKLARAGHDVELSARKVSIHSIDLVRYDYPTLTIDVSCGSGTYIRSLARDIGEALGVGGYCSRLTRTAVGSFSIDDAVAIEDISPIDCLISPLVALEALPKIYLDDSQTKSISLGRQVTSSASLPPGEAAAVDSDGNLAAIVSVQADGVTLRPAKVFCAL